MSRKRNSRISLAETFSIQIETIPELEFEEVPTVENLRLDGKMSENPETITDERFGELRVVAKKEVRWEIKGFRELAKTFDVEVMKSLDHPFEITPIGEIPSSSSKWFMSIAAENWEGTDWVTLYLNIKELQPESKWSTLVCGVQYSILGENDKVLHSIYTEPQDMDLYHRGYGCELFECSKEDPLANLPVKSDGSLSTLITVTIYTPVGDAAIAKKDPLVNGELIQTQQQPNPTSSPDCISAVEWNNLKIDEVKQKKQPLVNVCNMTKPIVSKPKEDPDHTGVSKVSSQSENATPIGEVTVKVIKAEQSKTELDTMPAANTAYAPSTNAVPNPEKAAIISPCFTKPVQSDDPPPEPVEDAVDFGGRGRARRVYLSPVPTSTFPSIAGETVEVEPVGQGRTLRNLKALLEAHDEKLSDITLISSDWKKFPAHKCILMAQSSYLKDKLETEEAKGGTIRFPDLSSRALDFVLHYLYCGEMQPFVVDSASEGQLSVSEVLHLAEKFSFNEILNFLDATCLRNMVNEGNVAVLLRLANKFSLKTARDAIKQFVKENENALDKILDAQ